MFLMVTIIRSGGQGLGRRSDKNRARQHPLCRRPRHPRLLRPSIRFSSNRRSQEKCIPIERSNSGNQEAIPVPRRFRMLLNQAF